MVKSLLLILFVLFFAVEVSLTAEDDLVKLQKKEKKRREKVKKSAIKITDENIERLSKTSQVKVSIMSKNNPGYMVGNSKIEGLENPDKRKGKTENDWRSEKNSIENSLKFYEEKVKTLTSRLNKLSSDYLIVDFPPSKTQIKIDMERTRADLEKSKKQVLTFKKRLEDFMEKARVANVPPGWLR